MHGPKSGSRAGLDTHRSHCGGRSGPAGERHLRTACPTVLPVASDFLYNNRFIRARQLWDGANHWWQERVVEFNMRSQLDLLRAARHRVTGLAHLGWAFAAGLVMWIAWVSLTLRRGVARVKPDRIGRAWLRATRKLARVAPARAAAEGPMAYRAASRRASARSRRAHRRARFAVRHPAFRARCQPPGHRGLRARSQETRGVMGTRHSSTPPTTNNNTSETIEARSLCVTPATMAMSSGPSTVANFPIML